MSPDSAQSRSPRCRVCVPMSNGKFAQACCCPSERSHFLFNVTLNCTRHIGKYGICAKKVHTHMRTHFAGEFDLCALRCHWIESVPIIVPVHIFANFINKYVYLLVYAQFVVYINLINKCHTQRSAIQYYIRVVASNMSDVCATETLKHIHIITIHDQEIVVVGDRRRARHWFGVRSFGDGQHFGRHLLRTDHVHHMLDLVSVIVGADLTIAIGNRRRWRIGDCRIMKAIPIRYCNTTN